MKIYNFKWKLFDIEYSSIKISELEKSDKRMDAEFYSVFNIENVNIINRKNCLFLSDISWKITDGTHQTPTYINDWVPFLSALNVLENSIEYNSYKFISNEEHNRLIKRAKVDEWDILLRKVWVWARHAWVVNIKPFDYSIFVSVALIKLLSEYKNINYYISTFINSFYGQFQLLRFNKWISQPDLHLEDIAKLKIPIPSEDFQQKIKELIIKSTEEKELSEKLYKESENLILNELWLFDYWLKTKNIKLDWDYELEVEENHSTTNYNILKELDRFDAEYWDYKYLEIISKIKNYKYWYDKIWNLFKNKKRSIKTYNEDFCNYLEIWWINIDSWETNYSYMNINVLPWWNKKLLKKWDVVISKVRTYRWWIAIIKDDNIIWTWALTVLKNNWNINQETLFIFLKSKPILELTLKFNTWTSYPTLNDEDITNLYIPKFNIEIQENIKKNINKSFEAKNKSKNLLEVAKKAVEIYIEKEEKDWFDYIKNNS